MRSRVAGAFVAACGLVLAACGGGRGTTTPPSPVNPPPTAGGPVNTATITIAGSVVSPKNIIVQRGSQVTFVNNDSRPHDMESDPHPEHTDCPELGQVGFLNPGQSRQSGNLNTARVCGFHDHELPDVAGLHGSITIQ